jgi:hypothetical protein
VSRLQIGRIRKRTATLSKDFSSIRFVFGLLIIRNIIRYINRFHMHQLIMIGLGLQWYRPSSEHIMYRFHVDILGSGRYHIYTFLNGFCLFPFGDYLVRLANAQNRKEIASEHLQFSTKSTVDHTSTYYRCVVINFVF